MTAAGVVERVLEEKDVLLSLDASLPTWHTIHTVPLTGAVTQVIYGFTIVHMWDNIKPSIFQGLG